MKTKGFDFFVTIVSVIVLTILRPITFYHWVDAFPTELLEIDEEADTSHLPSWHIEDILGKEEENEVVRREKALENLQKIFGIRGHIESKPTNRDKIPPQFMMELYNTIADSGGVTRGNNPYNAKVVRSFIERDTIFSHLYLFDVSGLEINESVLEAELHLYRKRTSPKVILDPSILASSYYLIKVYQVLVGKSMAEPDLHRLLNVHYVGAHASGWQVFNVKQAVLDWVSGAPNLGLMVTATNLVDDEVTVEFSRRNDCHNSKQPILVLFDDDGKGPHSKLEKIVPHYYTYDNEPEDFDPRSYDHQDGKNDEIITRENEDGDNLRRRKRHRESSGDLSNSRNPSEPSLTEEYSYGTQLGSDKLPDEIEFFHRVKKIVNNEEKIEENQRRNLYDEELLSTSPRQNYEPNEKNEEKPDDKSLEFFRQRRAAIRRDRQRTKKIEARKFVSERRTRAPQILVSMDIYERAMLREEMKKKNSKKHGRKREMKYPREKRSLRLSENEEQISKSHSSTRRNTTECGRHELYVDFKEIGLSSSIIAPKGYSAYHCQGICESPLSQDQQPTNHATVQGIVHKMGLVADVHMPCCVPTKLVSTTILFFDDNENVVLKVYEDMIADRCGCR